MNIEPQPPTKQKLVVDLENLTAQINQANASENNGDNNNNRLVSPSNMITKDLDLSTTTMELPQIFTDYYFHTGPLRADPPPIKEWPRRIPDNHATVKNKKKYHEQLQDYAILAESCRRAQKWRQMANAYMSMAILYDNCKDYKNAIKSYKKFCQVLTTNIIIPCRENPELYAKVFKKNKNQNQGQAQNTSDSDESATTKSSDPPKQLTMEFELGLYAAFNALGVDYQLMGEIAAAKAAKQVDKESEIYTENHGKCLKYFQKSLEYHLKYRDCIKETESNVQHDTNCNSALFIAYTDIGLLLLRCDHISYSINQFQHALRYSVHINSNIAQSIAICNISLSNTYNNQYSIGRACMERYLQLVTVLKDIQSQCYAFYNLGTMIVEWMQYIFDHRSENQQQNDEDMIKKTKIMEEKHISDAIYFFQEAIKVAEYCGDKQIHNQLKMKLAVATVLQTQL